MEQCDFCQRGKPLVIGKTDDYGISVKINYCPICGRNLNSKEYTPRK